MARGKNVGKVRVRKVAAPKGNGGQDARRTRGQDARVTKETPQQIKDRAAEIVKRLHKKYPNPRTALNYTTPLDLLVATILSAQATDKGINLITKDLFKKYKTAADYASADEATLQQEIKASGFFRQKTKALIGVGKMLQEKFGGKVPDDLEQLMELPGVARKTANVVLGNAFKKAVGVVVDRHVARVSLRLGLTRSLKPVEVEKDLMAILPRSEWIDFSHMVIYHGRETCTARKPKCAICIVNGICPSAFTFD